MADNPAESEVPQVSESEPHSSDLDKALKQLEWLTSSLSFQSNLISVVTLAHIGFAIFAIIYTILATDTSKYSGFYTFRPAFIFAEIFVLSVTVLLLLGYDRKIAKGEGLYQEISDELEWYVRREPVTKPNLAGYGGKDRPGLSTRLVLRDFVLAARLPFVGGTQGIAIYLVFNVILTITTLLAWALKVARP